MATILLAIFFMLVLFAAMAIGVMFGRAPIKGSCGGMSAMAGGGTCSICGGDPVKCDEASRPGSEATAADAGTVRRYDPRKGTLP